MSIEQYHNKITDNSDKFIEQNIITPYIKILRNIFWENFSDIQKGNFDSQNNILRNLSQLLQIDTIEYYINDQLIKDFVQLHQEVQTKLNNPANNQTKKMLNEQIIDSVVYNSSLYRIFHKLFTDKLKRQIVSDNNFVSSKKDTTKKHQQINLQKQLEEKQNWEQFFSNVEEQFRKMIKTKLQDIIRSKEITYKYYPGGWERKQNTK